MVQFNVDEEKKEKKRFLCYALCASNQRQILDAYKEKNCWVRPKWLWHKVCGVLENRSTWRNVLESHLKVA